MRLSIELTRNDKGVLTGVVKELGDVDKAMDQTKQKAKSFGSDISQSFSSVLQGFGQGIGQKIYSEFSAALGVVGSLTGKMLEYGSALVDTQAQTGRSIQSQQEWAVAAAASSVSAEEMTKAMAKMQNTIVTAPEKIAALGLSIEQIKAMNPDQQFEAIGKAINDIGDPAQRSAAAISVFGKAGAGLLKVFAEDMEAAREKAHEFGLVMTDDVAHSADDLGDKLGLLSTVWEGLTRNLVAGAAQSMAVHRLIEGLTDIIGHFSASVQKGDQSLGAWATAARGVAAVLVFMVDAVQLALDVWASLQLTWLSAEKIALSLAEALAILGKATAIGDEEKKSAQGLLDLIHSYQAANARAAADVVKGNTEQTNSIQNLHAAFAGLEKAVAGAGNATEAASTSIQGLGGTTFESAEAMKKAAEEAEKYQRALEGIRHEIAAQSAHDFAEQQAKANGIIHKQTEDLNAMHKAGEEAAKAIQEYGEKGWKEAAERIAKAREETLRWVDAAAMLAGILSSIPGILGIVGSAIGGFASTFQKLAQMFASMPKDANGHLNWGALTGGQKAQVGVAGLGVLGDIYGSGQNANSALGGLGQGAGKGAAFGAQFGPYGAVIGGVVGAVAGLIGYLHRPEWRKAMQDIGKQYGFDISEGLAKGIEESMKKLDISRKLAETLHIGDIMAEGVAAGKDPNAFMGQVSDLMKAVAAGTLPAKEGVEQLGKAFSTLADEAAKAGDMASQAMIDMIQQSRAAGIKIPEITAYVQDQIQNAIAGVAKFIHAVDLTVVFPGQRGPAGGMAHTGEEITMSAQQNAEDAATIFSGTFWAAVAEMGLVAAATAMGPAFAELKAKIKAAGLDMPEALSGLNHIFKLMDDPNFKAAMEALDGLSAALKGMTNAGYLTQSMFDAVNRSAENAFHAAIKAGASESEAFQAIAPYVQQILSMHDKYGTAIPKWVSDLIAKHPEIKFQTDPLEQVVKLLTQIAEKMGAIPTEINTDVNVAYHATGDPVVPGGPPPPGGGGGTGSGAGGGFAYGGISTGPTSGHWELLHGTEAVVPQSYFGQPISIGPGGAVRAKSGDVHLNFQGMTIVAGPGQDPEAIADAVVDRVEQNIRRRGKVHLAIQDSRA